MIQKFTAAAALIIAVATATPSAKAANVTLDGYGKYSLGNSTKYYPQGAPQGGRYKNLGADYYNRVTIKMDFVTNRSSSGSGSLSFELWAMPYKGATSGIVLMTKGLKALGPKKYHRAVSEKGYAIDLNSRRYPEFDLWEYTRSGWKFRDVLTFSKKEYL